MGSLPSCSARALRLHRAAPAKRITPIHRSLLAKKSSEIPCPKGLPSNLAAAHVVSLAERTATRNYKVDDVYQRRLTIFEAMHLKHR